MCKSLSEEAEATGWYVQRISVEPDVEARAVMDDSMGEEFKHFSMELEFHAATYTEVARNSRRHPSKTGDIVKRGEAAEEAASG